MKPTVRAEWRAVVLVCGKCTRKLNGGFGREGKTPLAKALRKWAGKGKGRKARVGAYEVPCLRICPQRAVTVVDGGDPGRWLIVAAGTPVAEVADRLGLIGEPEQHSANGMDREPTRSSPLPGGRGSGEGVPTSREGRSGFALAPPHPDPLPGGAREQVDRVATASLLAGSDERRTPYPA